MRTLSALSLSLATLVIGGCMLEVADEPATSEDTDELIAANKLAGNKLAGNKLAANKLAGNKLAASSLETKQLMDTADGRDVMSFIVGCAMPTGQSITLSTTAGASYSYPGWLGLAPAWATRAPTVSERRWVTACLLARTNVYGTAVNISMRHDINPALAASPTEMGTYNQIEGAFYGDLFATPAVWYACANRGWTQFQANSYRACALSQNGVTTDCGFSYTGLCNSSGTACSDKNAPYGNCQGVGTTYAEVITIFLTLGQKNGGTQ